MFLAALLFSARFCPANPWLSESQELPPWQSLYLTKLSESQQLPPWQYLTKLSESQELPPWQYLTKLLESQTPWQKKPRCQNPG